jgi:MoxR-like ATPase
MTTSPQPFALFHGDGRQRLGQADQLPPPLAGRLRQPERYLVDDGLRDACNVALLLGQPLLLTGEPGTGKSRFAHALAWEFGLGEPLVHAVKSTSIAKDLFYHYDALKRYQDIQTGLASPDTPVARYLTIQALGQAILHSHAPADLPVELAALARGEAPRRSVVLVDEVDKAPRDFPNDVLNEVEDLSFQLPELGEVTVQAHPDRRPLIVLTSNSERDLPDAFLRRCVYYHIPFPDPERLERIVALQLQDLPSDSALTREAIELFLALREPRSGLRKKPATAELLLWLLTLRRLLGPEADTAGLRGQAQRDVVRRSLGSLIKTADDRDQALRVVSQWLAD